MSERGGGSWRGVPAGVRAVVGAGVRVDAGGVGAEVGAGAGAGAA